VKFTPTLFSARVARVLFDSDLYCGHPEMRR
jgi:hypothetical protein